MKIKCEIKETYKGSQHYYVHIILPGYGADKDGIPAGLFSIVRVTPATSELLSMLSSSEV